MFVYRTLTVLGCDILYGRYLRTFGGVLPRITLYVAVEFSLQTPVFLSGYILVYDVTSQKTEFFRIITART